MSKALRAADDAPVEGAAEDSAEMIQYLTIQTLLAQAGAALDEAVSLTADLVAMEDKERSPLPTAQQDADDACEAQLRAVRAQCMQVLSSVSNAMNFCCVLGDDDAPRLMELAEQLRDSEGRRNSAADASVIQQVHDHSVNLGATCHAGNVRALEIKQEEKVLNAAQGGTTQEDNMTKEERAATIKVLTECPCSGFTPDDARVLEGLSDERITALQQHAQTVKAEREQLKALSEATPKALSEDEFLAQAPESIRTLVADKKAADAARKAELVEQLKTAQAEYKEDELTGMELKALERIARLTKVEVKNFSGRALPRAAEGEPNVYSNPPDPYAEALKARK